MRAAGVRHPEPVSHETSAAAEARALHAAIDEALEPAMLRAMPAIERQARPVTRQLLAVLTRAGIGPEDHPRLAYAIDESVVDVFWHRRYQLEHRRIERRLSRTFNSKDRLQEMRGA
jgi:hypothetical protein